MRAEYAARVLEAIRRSHLWTDASRDTGEYLENLTCPECGVPGRAFVGKAKPYCLKCNRANECGAATPVHSLFPELRSNVERDAPSIPGDPDRPAREYLRSRGIERALAGLAFRHQPNMAGDRGGVGFPLTNADGETVWNARLYAPDGGAKTRNQTGANFKGALWRHPNRKTDDPDRECFVCESVIDALSLEEMGQRAVAVPSAAATPEGIRDLPANIVLAFDNDPAGWKAVERWRRWFPDAPAALPPSGMDWNDFLVRTDDPAGEFSRRRGEFAVGTDAETLSRRIEAAERRARTERELKRINAEYAAILLGGKFRIIREFEDPIFRRPSIELSSREDFASFHSNRLVENPNRGKKGERDTVPVASLWMKWEGRRQYRGLVFDPPTAPGQVPANPDYYNLWTGFGIEPKPGDWSLLRDHIERIVCRGNADHARWLMAWMARMVQSPGGERPGSAVVIRGKRGTGKGTLISQFAPIFGPHFLHLTNAVHLTGRFNGHLRNAVVVFCDEGFWAGDKAAEGVLKGMITEDTLPCEDKNEKLVQVKNRINLFIASNNDWVIPAGLEERRFFVLETSDAVMQDRQYFGHIKRQMENGGRAGFLRDLLRWEIPEDIDLRNPPKTAALMFQIESSMGPVERWWYQILRDGALRASDAGWSYHAETAALYEDFVEFARRGRPNAFVMDPSPWARRFRELAPGITPSRAGGTDRRRGYTIPGLDSCRADFEKSVGMEVDWDEI